MWDWMRRCGAPSLGGLAVLQIAGCTLDSQGAGSATDADAASANPETTTGDSSTSADTTETSMTSTSAATASSTSSSSSSSTSTSSTSASTASSSGDDPTGMDRPASCREIRDAQADADNGFYTIAPGSSALDVFCDMQTAGGGWTLVARSVPDADGGDFGWAWGRGSADALDAPYALDVIAQGLAFDELLVGSRAEGTNWGPNVYRVVLPPSFTTFVDTSVQVQSIETIAGSCDPDGGPTMLHWVGNILLNERHYFRDIAGVGEYGLWHDGWRTYWNVTYGCSRGAELDGEQGMIMVR